jgi:hypothetical protein
MNAVVYDFCRRPAETHGDEHVLELLAARVRLAAIMEELKAIGEQVSQLAREYDERGLAAGVRRLLAGWNRTLALEAEFMAIDRRVRTLAAETRPGDRRYVHARTYAGSAADTTPFGGRSAPVQTGSPAPARPLADI